MLPAVGAFDLKMRPRVFAASGVSFVHICLTTVSYNTLFINLKKCIQFSTPRFSSKNSVFLCTHWCCIVCFLPVI